MVESLATDHRGTAGCDDAERRTPRARTARSRNATRAEPCRRERLGAAHQNARRLVTPTARTAPQPQRDPRRTVPTRASRSRAPNARSTERSAENPPGATLRNRVRDPRGPQRKRTLPHESVPRRQIWCRAPNFPRQASFARIGSAPVTEIVGSPPDGAGYAFGRSCRPRSASCEGSTGVGASVSGSKPPEIFGKAITSRMLSVRSSSITARSRPGAMPPCGGAP